MSSFPSRPRNPSRKEVEEVLGDVDFPLTKEQLVECVSWRSSEAAATVTHQLQALPLGAYASLDEVVRSIDTADTRGY